MEESENIEIESIEEIEEEFNIKSAADFSNQLLETLDTMENVTKIIELVEQAIAAGTPVDLTGKTGDTGQVWTVRDLGRACAKLIFLEQYSQVQAILDALPDERFSSKFSR